jgi:hypothetical protein
MAAMQKTVGERGKTRYRSRGGEMAKLAKPVDQFNLSSCHNRMRDGQGGESGQSRGETDKRNPR